MSSVILRNCSKYLNKHAIYSQFISNLTNIQIGVKYIERNTEFIGKYYEIDTNKTEFVNQFQYFGLAFNFKVYFCFFRRKSLHFKVILGDTKKTLSELIRKTLHPFSAIPSWVNEHYRNSKNTQKEPPELVIATTH